jgi:nicotinamidase-related amidase
MSMEKILKARQERIDTLHETRRDRTALLVIDMQRVFLEPGAALEVPPGRELIHRIKRLIDCCREISVPVIFTEFAYSSALPCLRATHSAPGICYLSQASQQASVIHLVNPG